MTRALTRLTRLASTTLVMAVITRGIHNDVNHTIEHPTTDIRHNIMIRSNNSNVYEYLHNKDCRTPILYLLPKIHNGIKQPPGRPIVSAVNSHTEKISRFIDHFLNTCASRVKSYISDTNHFLTTLESLGTIPDNSCLVTPVMTSLYTNIGNVQGLHALKKV